MATYSRQGKPLSGYANPTYRFWSRVDKEGPLHATLGRCWQWQGGSFDSGYGVIYVGGRNVRAHRYSWELHNGPVPADLQILHKCDNRLCVNPTHLLVGTSDDNIQDMIAKGRDRNINGLGRNAVLTGKLVKYIRGRYRRGSHTDGANAIAKYLGISSAVVKSVIRGTGWGRKWDATDRQRDRVNTSSRRVSKVATCPHQVQ